MQATMKLHNTIRVSLLCVTALMVVPLLSSCTRKAESKVEAIPVTAEVLAKAYRDNGSRADTMLKGKPLQITGTVTSVDCDDLRCTVILDDTVFCYTNRSEMKDLNKLNKGDIITMIGDCYGESLGAVDVHNSWVYKFSS